MSQLGQDKSTAGVSEKTRKDEDEGSSSHRRQAKSPAAQRQSSGVGAVAHGAGAHAAPAASAKSAAAGQRDGDACKILGIEVTTRQMAEAISTLSITMDDKLSNDTYNRLVSAWCILDVSAGCFPVLGQCLAPYAQVLTARLYSPPSAVALRVILPRIFLRSCIDNDCVCAQADLLGVTESTTGLPRTRILYSVRRTVTRVLPSLAEGDKGSADGEGGGGGARAGRASCALPRRGQEQQTFPVPPDMDEFKARVRVGATIEAEMDDTRGGTQWVVGQVQSLNAARATFTVKFTVQNDTEQGEWTDQYHWEERGREWRFARQGSAAQDRKAASTLVGGDDARGADGAEHRHGQHASRDSEEASSHAAIGDMEEERLGDGDDEVSRRVRPGVAIEAEMDDSHGGTEWIRGVVISANAKTKSFKVQFKVTNDDESGEWTDQYR